MAEKVIEIAHAEKPEFLIAQFGRSDDVFHKYGPSSPSVIPALKATDSRMKRLAGYLKPLGYGVIVFFDHGRHDITEGELKSGHGTDIPGDCLVPCTWI